MAPQKKQRPQSRIKITYQVPLNKYVNLGILKRCLVDPHYLTPVCCLLFFMEIVLNVSVIERVRYTEIDWIAYMQEVEGFLNGTLDYQELRGQTGPLVYPAGFVYIYTVLYYVTSHGKNIYAAQYIFLGLYLIQNLLAQRIFMKTLKIPPYFLIMTCITSYRIHSIFVLRLFNDPIAVLLFYVSLNFFISNKWTLGSIFYSLAVSVKMNILLYAPCLLLAYLTNLSLVETFVQLFICAFIQLVLGLPFLYGNFISYIKGSFDLSRVFEHKWTVNYRFLPREHFENPFFHIFLLFLHMVLLIVFLPHILKYLRCYAKLRALTGGLKAQFENDKKRKRRESEKLSKIQRHVLGSFEKQLQAVGGERSTAEEQCKLEINLSKITQLFVLPFFVTNLIGVACARSLHYQFYSWYFHSLVYLVHCTGYRKQSMFMLLAMIEYCWNVYPSTGASSVMLHCCHAILLFGVYNKMSG